MVDCFVVLKKYFTAAVLPSEPDLSKKVLEALSTEWVLPYLHLCLLLGYAAGKWTRWVEGCYCHKEELTTLKTWRARRRAMEKGEAEVPSCAWKAKRLMFFTMNIMKDIADDITAMTSVAYTEILLTVPHSVAARIVQIEVGVKQKWIATVTAKQQYTQEIPHLVGALWACYVGYALRDVKAVIARGFRDYREGKPEQFDELTHYWFGETTEDSRNLRAFADNPETWPHDHGAAFWVSGQETAFVSLSERYTEGLHVKVKLAGRRGTKFSKPAVTCSRQHRPQVERWLKSKEEWEWVLNNWNDVRGKRNGYFSQLLSHLLTPTEI